MWTAARRPDARPLVTAGVLARTLDSIGPAAGAEVMGTGIVSIALSLDGQETLSRVILVIAVAIWVTLAVLLPLRAARDPARFRADTRTPVALTSRVATCVLGTRLTLLGWTWAGVAALVIALVLSAALIAPLLAGWKSPTVGVSLLAAVCPEALAVLAATLAGQEHTRWLLIAALVPFALGLGLYLFVISRFDFHQLVVGRGDHWITGGALGISALAAASIFAGARVLGIAGVRGGALKDIAIGLWVLSMLWLLVLLFAETRWRRLSAGSRGGRRCSRSGCTPPAVSSSGPSPMRARSRASRTCGYGSRSPRGRSSSRPRSGVRLRLCAVPDRPTLEHRPQPNREQRQRACSGERVRDPHPRPPDARVEDRRLSAGAELLQHRDEPSGRLDVRKVAHIVEYRERCVRQQLGGGPRMFDRDDRIVRSPDQQDGRLAGEMQAISRSDRLTAETDNASAPSPGTQRAGLRRPTRSSCAPVPQGQGVDRMRPARRTLPTKPEARLGRPGRQRQEQVRARKRGGTKHRIDLEPEPSAGDEHEALGHLRELVGELHRDTTAERMTDQRHAVVPERHQHITQERGQRSERVVAAARAGRPVSREIDREHGGVAAPAAR